MNPFFAGVAYELSKRLVDHQDRPRPDAERVPLWRLLVDEVRYLTGRSVRRRSDGSSDRSGGDGPGDRQ